MVLQHIWVAVLWPLGCALHEVHLDKTGSWTLRNANGSISVQASNVSSTHVALMEAGVLEGDPFFRDNEVLWSWVARENWSYSGSFASTSDMLSRGSQVIHCRVDTIAQVVLNGRVLGKTTNSFVEYEFDVSGLLRGIGEANTIDVHIESPLNYAVSEAGRYPYEVPEFDYTPEFGPNHHNFVRKSGSDWGWDWGPAFVPSGVASLRLVSRAVASLSGVTARQWHNPNGSVTLDVEAHISAVASGDAALRAVLAAPRTSSGVDGGTVSEAAGALQVAPGLRRVRLRLLVDAPRLWWPAGAGEQPLYALELRLSALGERRLGERAADESALRRRIGLRTAQLVQEPLPGGGTSFFFMVNGLEVFAKGSNMIPQDVFAPRAAEEAEWVLRSAHAANQNMVRVWGGGWYQPDAFYDLADELGVMIWQEMMFACAAYPAHRSFLESVSTEISQQALRLQHHASVVIWGGNNENEGYVQDQMGPKMGPAPHEVYLADYVKLYIDTGMTALRAVDPDVAFVDSSPSNGVISTEPYTKRWGDVNDVLRGDVHYYNYDADCEDFTTYPRAHFVSEHGFQSFPSFLAYQPFLSKSDWSRNSTELRRRQRHPEGQEQMLKMLGRHFRLPPEHAAGEAAQRKAFDDFLYLTQVQQSRCYETAIAQWRRLRADPSVKTMGVLYWQLNDIWPGPSWSSIERSGAWRLTHSAVQRSYDTLLPSLVVDKGKIRSFLTSDLASTVQATLHVALHRWGVQQRLEGAHVLSCNVTVAAGTSECPAIDLSAAMEIASCASADCFVSLEGSVMVGGVPKSLSAQAFLTPLKAANLPIASLQIGSPTKVATKRASVTVTSNATAVYVALESAAVVGRFVPNAFLIFPGDQVLVDFEAREAFDIDRWHAGLKIRSLRDTYDATLPYQGGGNGRGSVADPGGHRQDVVSLFQ